MGRLAPKFILLFALFMNCAKIPTDIEVGGASEKLIPLEIGNTWRYMGGITDSIRFIDNAVFSLERRITGGQLVYACEVEKQADGYKIVLLKDGKRLENHYLWFPYPTTGGTTYSVGLSWNDPIIINVANGDSLDVICKGEVISTDTVVNVWGKEFKCHHYKNKYSIKEINLTREHDYFFAEGVGLIREQKKDKGFGVTMTEDLTLTWWNVRK